MESRARICRLCLKPCESFKAIQRDMRDALNKLLPIINLSSIHEPVTCTNCAEMLVKYSDFKTACFCIHDHIVSLANNDGVKLSLKDVRSIDENSIGVPEDVAICGFCMCPAKNYSPIFFNVEKGEMLEKMIAECLPELDLSIIKEPVICTTCHRSLEKCFRFMTNCLITEEKIKEYCGTRDANSRDQIELGSLLQFTTEDLIASKEDAISVDIIKIEQQFGGDIVKLEQMFFDDSEDANESFMEVNDQKVNNEHAPEYMLAYEEENKLGSIEEGKICEDSEIKQKEENLVEMEDQKFLLDEEIEIKTDVDDFSGFVNGVVLTHPEGPTGLHGRPKCLISNLEEDLSNYTLVNKHVSKKMTQCESCSFETEYENLLKRHMLEHKDLSKIKVHKCGFCSFQTKYSCSLKLHLIRHKGSLAEVYQCHLCSFQSNRKDYLRKHVLVHRAVPSEVTMYKCDSCSFQTKSKYYLKSHLLNHKDPTEVTMYECDSCSFQTKHKASLTSHLFLHKDILEVTIYKCDSCSFQSLYKNSLRRHLSLHKCVLNN